MCFFPHSDGVNRGGETPCVVRISNLTLRVYTNTHVRKNIHYRSKVEYTITAFLRRSVFLYFSDLSKTKVSYQTIPSRPCILKLLTVSVCRYIHRLKRNVVIRYSWTVYVRHRAGAPSFSIKNSSFFQCTVTMQLSAYLHNTIRVIVTSFLLQRIFSDVFNFVVYCINILAWNDFRNDT